MTHSLAMAGVASFEAGGQQPTVQYVTENSTEICQNVCKALPCSG
jgi:hypothetical protein